ncbi:MAG: O-sialoglycoprotein endopeptidase [Firmicutes bacterium]|nr:O-sialoglycoprotein endopeptidase [Bacillota bacterium]
MITGEPKVKGRNSLGHENRQAAILGIDTSCYTTSVAVVGGKSLVIDRRLLLEVPLGKRGLRQAEAVFQHVKNLPLLLAEVLPRGDMVGVAVSSKPRSGSGSYMPVFKAGEAIARSLALAWDVPCFLTSHQAGHIWAGLWGGEICPHGRFLALHISGGTTEIVSVGFGEVAGEGEDLMEIEHIGGSLDIHAGQLIDRIGVKMGLPFPAGPRLERLAIDGRQRGIPPFILPVSVSGLHLNFSGPETAAIRALEAGSEPAGVAQGIERCVAESLTALVKHAAAASDLNRVLVVGGVAANQHVRRYLENHLEKVGINTAFAPRGLSSDNAVGVAAYGRWRALGKMKSTDCLGQHRID